MLDVGKLATLRAVIAHGSFSAAGHAIGLTQPAVSRQVSLLEQRVGTQLVRRTQQGVQPTEAGRLLAEHTEGILDRLKLAQAPGADLPGLRPRPGPPSPVSAPGASGSARSSPPSSSWPPSSPSAWRRVTQRSSPATTK